MREADVDAQQRCDVPFTADLREVQHGPARGEVWHTYTESRAAESVQARVDREHTINDTVAPMLVAPVQDHQRTVRLS